MWDHEHEHVVPTPGTLIIVVTRGDLPTYNRGTV